MHATINHRHTLALEVAVYFHRLCFHTSTALSAFLGGANSRLARGGEESLSLGLICTATATSPDSPVHDVEVEVVSPAVHYLLALLAQTGELRVQDRGTDLAVARTGAHLLQTEGWLLLEGS